MRTLKLEAEVLLVVPEFGAEDGLRSIVVLNPVNQVRDDVVGGTCNIGESGLAEHPRTGARDATDTAVSHARDTEESHEVIHIGVVDSESVGNLEVVTLGVAGGDERVSHTVVHDHLLASGPERAKIAAESRDVAVVRVERVSVGVVGLIESGDVKGGGVVDTVVVPVVSDTLGGSRELAKSESIDLGSVEESWVEQLTGGAVQLSEDLVDGGELVVRQAVVGGVAAANRDDSLIEHADGRILDDTIVHAIESGVTLVEDVALNEDPLVLSEEARVSRVAGKLDETCAPVLQMVEVCSRRTGDYAVEVIWEVLCRVQTLRATSGAADVVCVVLLFAVELLHDFLASHDRLVA